MDSVPELDQTGAPMRKWVAQTARPSRVLGTAVLFTWEKEAHSDVIRAIQYINATDVPLVFTAGIDKMACIWGLDGAPKGRLTQGYMMKANYFWDFPLNRHEQSNGAR